MRKMSCFNQTSEIFMSNGIFVTANGDRFILEEIAEIKIFKNLEKAKVLKKDGVGDKAGIAWGPEDTEKATLLGLQISYL